VVTVTPACLKSGEGSRDATDEAGLADLSCQAEITSVEKQRPGRLVGVTRAATSVRTNDQISHVHYTRKSCLLSQLGADRGAPNKYRHAGNQVWGELRANLSQAQPVEPGALAPPIKQARATRDRPTRALAVMVTPYRTR